MTADLLDFPVLDAPPPPAAAPVPAPVSAPAPSTVATVPLSIKETVLAQFKDAEVGLVALAEKYRAVAYDCTTTKGMNEAKAARADLRDNGRLALTKTEARVKADVNDLKRVMAGEVERLVAIVQPVEDSIDAQIKAEEARKAEEKRKREEAEAARVAAHRERMDKIGGYLARCQQPGMTAERIQRGIDLLAAVTFGPDWQEFAVPAADLQCKTLDAMRALHAAAVEREAEAARLAEQRAEQERQATELAAERARLAEAAETLRQQQEALAAQQAAAEKQRQEEADRATLIEKQQRMLDEAEDRAIVSNPPFTAGPGVSTPAAQEGVASNPLQPQPVATFPVGDAVAEVEAGAIPLAQASAPAPSVTLTEHQLLLQEACALLDAWLVKPPTKKQVVECLAQINSLRTRGGIPHPLS